MGLSEQLKNENGKLYLVIPSVPKNLHFVMPTILLLVNTVANRFVIGHIKLDTPVARQKEHDKLYLVISPKNVY